MDWKALTDLYRHMEWADAAVWASALSSDAASSDERLRNLLYHIHVVQTAFLRTWRNEPSDEPYPAFEALPAMAAWARDRHRALSAHLATLNDDTLAAPMPVPWVDLVEKHLGRVPGTTTLGETVLQVALHSQYHRGQVNARLRELGAPPPLVDYIAWLWSSRPTAAWPPVA